MHETRRTSQGNARVIHLKALPEGIEWGEPLLGDMDEAAQVEALVSPSFLGKFLEGVTQMPLCKAIIYFGKPVVVACDGQCNKAWGTNSRPKLYYMEDLEHPRKLVEGETPRDWDDFVYCSDDSLGEAPADPGTYEGGDGKPSSTPLENPLAMNKWCTRECERSKFVAEGLILPTFSPPTRNLAVNGFDSYTLVTLSWA